MSEQPLEQAVDPNPSSRSKGPSLVIDSHTSAWDVSHGWDVSHSQGCPSHILSCKHNLN